MSDKFTARDYRQLSEALDRIDAWLKNAITVAAWTDHDLLKIRFAARRFLDRYQICQTCDGDGFFLPSGNHSLAELANMKGEDCPDCVGGLVPNQERLEQAAHAIRRTAINDTAKGFASAVVRAFDKEPT